MEPLVAAAAFQILRPAGRRAFGQAASRCRSCQGSVRSGEGAGAASERAAAKSITIHSSQILADGLWGVGHGAGRPEAWVAKV